jgi:solute carrier family 39 (zinc transporter), member 9
MLPLAVSLSPSQLRLISTVGMGVLVGTSLIVIIPEGIETLYSVRPAATAAAGTAGTGTGTAGTVHGAMLWKREEEDGHHHQEDAGTAHKYVGLSLISGFILMYLIDVLPAHTHPYAPQPHHIEIDNLRSLSAASSPLEPPAHLARPSSTTLGLVIHAAADGIALGASSTSSNAALEAIIFLAIMLHKAPAAFGLSAVLLRAGLGKRQVRAHLIVFSMAAPAGAILTWILVNLLGGDAGGAGMQWWTGVLLLFSGGTFL